MSRGFSLLEVLVALVVVVVGVFALITLATISTRANLAAKQTTFASVLAAEKMEQLRALTWVFDVAGNPISDLASDVAAGPAAAGGVSLSVSPPDALVQNEPGYCDFLDANGASLGGGAAPPPSTAFIRRWSISALPSNPVNTLVLQVVVVRPVPFDTDRVRLVDIRGRRAM